VNLTKLEDQLIRHEGLRLDLYEDTVGIATIGVGRNLEDVGLRSEAEARFLLRSDIVAIRAELQAALPWMIADLDEVRQRVLMDMAFNLGVSGLMKFTKTLRLVADGHYLAASEEMLRGSDGGPSKWATQVGQRATTLSTMMAEG
jgi:lysozyme